MDFPLLSLTKNSHSLVRQLVIALTLALVLCTGAFSALAEQTEGFIEPNVRVDIGSPYRALLKKLPVKEGDVVKKGQILAQLDTRLLESALAVAKAKKNSRAKIESAKALHALRQSRLASLEKLARTGDITIDELNRAKADAAIARAQLDAAKEEREILELEYQQIVTQIEEKKIRSPINGVVVRIFKQEEELVGAVAEEFALMTVVQLDPVKATFYISPEKATALKPDMQVPVKIGNNTKPVTGTVDFVSPVVEAESGMVRLVIKIANPDGKIASGLPAVLEIN